MSTETTSPPKPVENAFRFPFPYRESQLTHHLKLMFPKEPILRSPEELSQNNIAKEEMVRVTSASVVYANYPLLRNDFSQLSDAALSRAGIEVPQNDRQSRFEVLSGAINSWLLRNTAFVSGVQSRQDIVNSYIHTGKEKTHALRPPNYGRAVIYSLADNAEALDEPLRGESETTGLLDVKGTGIGPNKVPTFLSHGDGLLSLGDAFLEYVNQQLIQGIFWHSGRPFETLPIYAIINLGFEIKTQHGSITGPASLLVRRAHTRPVNPGGLPKYNTDQQLIQLEVEQLLRKYGITGCNYITGIHLWKEDGVLKATYGGRNVNFLNEEQRKNLEKVSHYNGEKLQFEGVNIQHTGEYGHNPSHVQLVDFGSYNPRNFFRHPLLSLVSDKLLRWGGCIWPDFDTYVQPDPDVRVPWEHWGNSGRFFGFDAEYSESKQNIICHGLANAVGAGRLSPGAAMRYLDAYLQTATNRWETTGPGLPKLGSNP